MECSKPVQILHTDVYTPFDQFLEKCRVPEEDGQMSERLIVIVRK